jgi:hypothetical protein
MPRIDDFFSELRAVESYQARRGQARSKAASWTPDQAANLALAARLYPDLRPGALLALGKGNYRADHPLVQQVAEYSARVRLRDHPNGLRYGQSAVNPAMARLTVGQKRLLREDLTEGPGRQAQFEARYRRDPGVDISDEDVERRVAQFTERLAKPVAEGYEAGLSASDRKKIESYRRQIERERGPRLVRRPQPEVEDTGGGVLSTIQKATGTTPTSGQRVRTAGASELAEEAITTPVRSAFMVLDAPVQEAQGQVRNLYALAHGDPKPFWEPQSDLGITLTSGITDAGTGFFVDPESEVAAERRRREAQRGQIGGHNITLGRWAVDALTPFDPDTKPAMVLSGLVDAGVQLYADPSAAALGKVGKVRGTKALFAAPDVERSAGVFRGLRMGLAPTDASRFLDSDQGQNILSVLAAEKSPAAIWQTTNRKWSMDLARQIADEAPTPEAVRAILEPQLGASIRKVSDVTPLAAGTAKANPMRVMPTRGAIDAHDKDTVAWELDAQMRNAGASDASTRAVVDKVARARGPIGLNAAIRDTHTRIDGLLHVAGVDDALVRSKLVRLHDNTHKEVQDTFRAQITEQTPTYRELMVNGTPVQDSGAHLWNELAPQHMSLADARSIRRNVSKYRWALTSKDGGARLPTLAAEFLINDMWKPMQLIRAAWTVRVVGEEQLRMAAAGYDSMFKHPGSYIAHRIGRKGAGDVKGGVIDEANQFKNAMSQGHGGWADHAVVPTGIKTTYLKGNVHEFDRFVDSWASELNRLANDPVAQQVARSASMDDAFEWFTRGAGNTQRGDLALAHPGKFDNLDQARAYLETVQQRIDTVTGGNGDLLDAVKTGRLAGDDLMSGTGLNRQAVSRLESYVDGFAPEQIIGEEVVTVPMDTKGKFVQRMDRFVDTAFGFLMTNRTNNLSRSPTFKQAYWKEAERLVGFSTPDTKAKILAEARANNISKRAITRMERTRPTGEATIDDVDLYAKAVGLEETKTLLYDLSRRGRFMDAARLIFPFGEAWSELLTRWLGKEGLVATNPKTIRRFQQVIQGARGEDFGEVMGAPEGQGFFWKNEFGEEVFVYPGSRLLTDKLIGVPVPLVGRVQGLNMFGSLVPGFGPAVQMPVGWFLANKPGPEWFKSALGEIEGLDLGPLGTVEEALLPFGSPGQADQSEVFSATTYLPNYLKTAVDFALGGDGHEKQWADTVMGVAAHLRSTGKYGNSKADMQQLMEDAEHDARWMYLIKSLGQGSLPASPTTEWEVVTPNDGTVRLRALAEEYVKLREEDFETADQVFLDQYGSDVLAAIQPKTKSAEYGLPTTKVGAQWVLEHPGIEDDLEHTYGFFAPSGGEFDYSLYNRQLLEGDRVQLDPDVWTRLMNQTKGDILWYQAKDSVEGHENTDEGREFLAQVRSELYDRYPGWGDSSGLPQRPELDVMVRELYEARDHDAVRDTDAGRGLAKYLAARDEVVAWAESEGHKRSNGLLSTAEAVEEGHIALRQYAARLVSTHPGFESLWDVVLSREIEEVEGG